MSHIVQVHMKCLGGYEEIFVYTCYNLMTHEESVTFLNPLKKEFGIKCVDQIPTTMLPILGSYF